MLYKPLSEFDWQDASNEEIEGEALQSLKDRFNKKKGEKMVKAKMNNGDLVFGLSEENLKRLKEKQPILINLKEMGLESRNVIITYGETEEAIYKDMLEYIDLDKTKIHI